MKVKILSVMISLTVLMGLVACSSSDEGPMEESSQQKNTETNDNSTTTNTNSTSTNTNSSSTSHPNWYSKAVVYEIFVRSFYDSNGDGKGDFQGLIDKLDYLTNLGVNAVWLMPINESPSYHGYDITDYYNIESDYGGNSAFDSFITAAHQRGIRVIMDLVINHTSDQHQWFQKSAQNDSTYANWYVWTNEDPSNLTGWQRPWGGGTASDVWILNSTRNAYYYAAFWGGMPDLNYNCPDVKQEIKNIATYWLNKGVDGFRLDAARYIVETGPYPNQADTQPTIDWWKEFEAHIRSVNPDAITVGEVWTANSTVKNYYQNGQGLDSAFNFDFAQSVPNAINSSDPSSIKSVISYCNGTGYGKFFAPFLDNHDDVLGGNSRLADTLSGDYSKQKLAAVLLMTVFGTPYIYYGTEIGMKSGSQSGDERKRTPMHWNSSANAGFTTGTPWENLSDYSDPINVSYQQNDPSSLLNLYKKLATIRTQYQALYADSAYTELSSSDSAVMAYLRERDSQQILVALNFSSSTKTNTISFSGTSVTNGTGVSNLITGEVMPDITDTTSYQIILEPYGYAVALLVPSNPPSVNISITQPSNGDTFTNGTAITVQGNCSSYRSSVTNVEVFTNGVSVGYASSSDGFSSWSKNLTLTGNGQVEISAVAYATNDSGSHISSTNAITVNVQSSIIIVDGIKESIWNSAPQSETASQDVGSWDYDDYQMFAITNDSTNLYILIDMGNGSGSYGNHIIVVFDTPASSGVHDFSGMANYQHNTIFLTNNLEVDYFLGGESAGNSTLPSSFKLYNSSGSDTGSSIVSASNGTDHLVEISVPLSALGVSSGDTIKVLSFFTGTDPNATAYCVVPYDGANNSSTGGSDKPLPPGGTWNANTYLDDAMSYTVN